MVIVIAQTALRTSGEHHAVVVAHCERDGSLACQNSWGASNTPLFIVRPADFVAAFAICVEILGQHVVGNDGPPEPPPELSEWAHMWPPLPSELVDLDDSDADSDDTIQCESSVPCCG